MSAADSEPEGAQERERRWLERVRDLCHELASESDALRLFPRILDAAVEIAEAERGFLVLVADGSPGEAPNFHVRAARGFDQSELAGADGEVSRTVVKRVLEQGKGLVTSHDQDDDIINVTSVMAREVLSIISVPMRLRGEIRGVLYLDHRRASGAFSPRDLPPLETFAAQAALALESAEAQLPREEPGSPREAGGLLGSSPAMLNLRSRIRRVSRSWEHVLVLGESGSGKELVAREIHQRGSHAAEPFVAVNCAAVAETLLQSELFGHRRGAFSGAVSDRAGLFLEAGRGSLFLDEVGDMGLAMQSKLLRVLQERQVRAVGADRQVPFRCRVVAATHRDLRGMVEAGTFREDLYYRLDVLRIEVPPLRARAQDIPELIRALSERAGRPQLRFTPRALELLTSWTWPGNVRELENELRRLSVLGRGSISAQQLSSHIVAGRGVSQAPGELAGKTLGDVEERMVEAALRDCKGNKTRAARQLGIPRTSLYRLIERFGLES